MIEDEALWYEFGHANSQQEGSSEGNLWAAVPSARALSQVGAGPSGRNIEKVDSDDIEVVYSKGMPSNATIVVLDSVGVKSDAGSHPGEGMLLKNPRSSVQAKDVKL